MYSFSQLKRGLDSPSLFCRELNRLYHRRLNQRRFNDSGTDIFTEDWDNLLLLDACRYDMFEENSDLPGELSYRISRGSSTPEFLLGNFHQRELLDTVYVTANPQLHRKRDRIDAQLHAVVDVWADEGWDEEYGTVLPETVVEAALDAADEFPHKRLIIHFMQPHYPFLTDETDFDKGHLETTEDTEHNLWNQLMEGALDVRRSEVWNRYEDNLERVLPHVSRLLSTLEGKTVVTSDHGNMVGERARPIPIKEWGHPRGQYVPHLVKVPWLVHVNGERKSIERGNATDVETKQSDDVADRLRQLGYKE